MRTHHCHTLSIALAAACCAAAIAACGSSGKTGGATPTAIASRDIKFAECMRSHGVPNFPDPGANGPNGFGPNSAINPQSPAFQSAQKACAKLQPGGTGLPQMSESRRLAAVAFAKCMRKHGLPNFPDPRSSSAGSSPTLVLRGLEFPIGQGLSPKSPAFKQAATACGLRLP